jgi:two-component system, cell cycle sensor histidine kinase and response regulator CckA
VTLSVTDTGAGMDAEVIRHVFEPYATMNDREMGLTMAMVYGIVRGAGGGIGVTSEPGHGTTFTVSLPRVAGTTIDGSGSQLTAAAGGPRTGTILIVEDQAAVRHFASRVLKTAGYRVLTAEDGDSAIELLRQEPVQLLLSDGVHPGPMGPELASKLVTIQPGTPLLWMSGWGSEDDWVRAGWFAPGGHFLRKPFTYQALLEAVDKAIAAGTLKPSLAGEQQRSR